MCTLLPPHTNKSRTNTQEEAGANEDADSNIDTSAHEIDTTLGAKWDEPTGITPGYIWGWS